MILEWIRQKTAPSYEARLRDDVELVMYGRQFGCVDQIRAGAWLDEHGVPYRMIDVGRDAQAASRLEQWVGYQSVPTFVIATPGKETPVEPPAALNGHEPRGVDRGTMITEPSIQQLAEFLLRHGLLAESSSY